MALLYAVITLVFASFICPVVFFIFKYAMKEKTYDERMAEQRKKLAMEHNIKAKSKHQPVKKSVKKLEKEKPQSEKKNKVIQSPNTSGKEAKKDSFKKLVSAPSDKVDGAAVSKKKNDRGHSKSSTSSRSSKQTTEYVEDQNLSDDDNNNQDSNLIGSEDDDKSSISESVITSSSRAETSNAAAVVSVLSQYSNPNSVAAQHSGNDSECSSVTEKVVTKKTQSQNSSSETADKCKTYDHQQVKKQAAKPEDNNSKPKSDEKNKDSKMWKQKADDKLKLEDEKSKEKLLESPAKNKKSVESANADSCDIANGVEGSNNNNNNKDIDSSTESETASSDKDDTNINVEKSPGSSKKLNGPATGAGKSSPVPAAKGQRQTVNTKNTKKQTTELKTLQKLGNEVNGPLNVALLVPVLAKAELSRSEIQNLIDLLLNKQQENGTMDAEWIGGGRQDPMVKLKKQLAEKEKALVAEQEAHQAIQNKVKELRAELNVEKHTNRQREEVLNSRQNDMEALNVRLHAVAEEKQNLAKQLQQLQAKLNEERLISRSLKDENNKTKNNLQQELLSQRQQLEMHIAHLTEQNSQTIMSLETQLSQLHVRLQDQENANAQMNEEIVLLRERVAMQDNQIAHYQQTHPATQDLMLQLEELKNIKSILEREIQNSHGEATRLSNELKTLTEQLNRKTKDIENFNHIVQNMKIENEELLKENSRNNEQITAHYNDKQQLQMEVEKLKQRIVELKENSQNSNELEGLKSEVTAFETKLAEKNSEVNELRERLSQLEAFSQNHQNRSVELQGQEKLINELKVQLEKQQAKNNDLRSKNWKAMEALSSMEKTLETKVKGMPTSSNEIIKKEREAVIQKIKCLSNTVSLPSPPASYEDDIWFEYLEKAFTEATKIGVSNHPSPIARSFDELSVSKDNVLVLDELEKQNRQLQTMVSHYKSIISDTEGMLNSLQKHVEQEENRWSEQVRILNDQIHVMNEKVHSLKSQLTTLSDERNRLLDKVKNIQNGCIQNDVRCNEQKLNNCVSKCVPLLGNSSVNDNSISS